MNPANNKPSLLNRLGYEVIACECGVYHLREITSTGECLFEGIGILHFPDRVPVEQQTRVHLLRSQNLRDDTDPLLAERVLHHWQTLKASWLGESGIDVTEIGIESAGLGRALKLEDLDRGDDGRSRPVAVMQSGDIVCFD